MLFRSKGSKKSLGQVKSAVKTAAIAASSIMSHAEHKKLHAFLQTPEASLLQEDPISGTGRVQKYDFKSGGVIELLEKLQHDFETQHLDAQKAETNAINAHALALQAQDAAIAAAQASFDKKTQVLADQEADLAGAEQDKTDEEASLSENEKTLHDTVAECTTKANEYEERSRSEEHTSELQSP